jgi:hypothetical protein
MHAAYINGHVKGLLIIMVHVQRALLAEVYDIVGRHAPWYLAHLSDNMLNKNLIYVHG